MQIASWKTKVAKRTMSPLCAKQISTKFLYFFHLPRLKRITPSNQRFWPQWNKEPYKSQRCSSPLVGKRYLENPEAKQVDDAGVLGIAGAIKGVGQFLPCLRHRKYTPGYIIRNACVAISTIGVFVHKMNDLFRTLPGRSAYQYP